MLCAVEARDKQLSLFREVDLDGIRDVIERDGFAWVDLVAPHSDEIERLGTALGWSPLLVEDVARGSQRPKIDEYSERALIVAYGVERPNDTGAVRMVETAIVVHGNYVVTVHDRDLPRFAALRATMPNEVLLTEAAVVHRILDLLVDSTMAAAEAMTERVEALEPSFDRASTTETITSIRALRHDLVRFRLLASAQRVAMASTTTAIERVHGFEVGIHDHFRDVVDHAYRVVDFLEMAHQLLDSAANAHFAILSARQGKVAQRLTVVSTIFLPLTFVTGFFGQNFGWMVDHVDSRDDFLAYGVGACAVTAIGLFVVFRRLRWW